MYIAFDSFNGSNPYIAANNETLFEMVCKYISTQSEPHIFIINERRKWNGKPGYTGKKEVLRAFAQEWQSNFSRFNYSMLELANWCDFFMEYGKKYGLLREFYENGII